MTSSDVERLALRLGDPTLRSVRRGARSDYVAGGLDAAVRMDVLRSAAVLLEAVVLVRVLVRCARAGRARVVFCTFFGLRVVIVRNGRGRAAG